MTPKYSAELIAELNGRVRAHNEAGGARVRLTDLKKWYAHGYQGPSDPDRAVSAWANVDRHMTKLAGRGDALAKAGTFDGGKHPRGRGGKFASSGGAGGSDDDGAPEPAPIAMALPTTQAGHRALQASNAAYAALTSDVVPERRNQVAGAWLRTGLGTLAGAALVLPLMRHGGSSQAGRLVRRGFALGGRYAASVPAAAVAYPLASAGEAAISPIARRLGRPIAAGSFYRGADAVAHGAGYVGERVGNGVGYGAAHGAHILLRGVDAAAGSHPNPRIAALRRIGVAAGLSAGTGALLTAPIKGTILDPEVIGANQDAFSYRTIQKMAGGADVLDGVIAGVLEKGAADSGVLAKSGLYSLFGRRVLPVVAGIAAAAGGAGAAEGAHAVLGTRAGDQYRDAHGRFASRANAVTLGAGLAGAAAGGIGAYLALRSHNIRALSAAVLRGASHVDNAIALARRPEGSGEVAGIIKQGNADILGHELAHQQALNELSAGRSKAINDKIAADPDYQAGVKKLDVYGSSHEAHYKERIRHEVNGKLATILSGINEFRIPGKGKPDGWITVGNVRAAAGGSAGRADAAARDAVLKAVDSATPEEFNHAIAGLLPQQKATALKWFEARQPAIDGVEDQMAAHKGKLDDLNAKVADAEAAHRAAGVVTKEAKAVADGAVGADAEAAGKNHVAAITAEEAASAAVTKARQAVLKHKAKPSGVISPVTGEPVPPASDMDIQAMRSGLRTEAHGRAEKAVDSKIKSDTTKLTKKLEAKKAEIKAGVETARSAQIAKIEARGHRLLAAQAMLGRRHNIVPERAVFASKRAQVAAGQMAEAHGREMAALRDVISAQNMNAALKVAKDGRVPEGMTREAAADLAQRESAVHHELANAMERHRQARLDTATAARRLGKQAGGFRQQMLTQPQGPKVGKLQVPVYRALLRDIDRASAGMQDAAHAFLASPSGVAVRNLAQSGYDHAAGAVGSVYGAGRDVARALTMRETVPGSGKYEIDPRKLLVGSPIAAALTGEVAHDAYRYGRDQIGYQLGLSDKKPGNAPRQIQIEKHIDPVTGGGFIGLSLPDPSGEKGERVLLWGEHFKDAMARGEALHVGSRISSVRGKVAEQQSRQGGGGQGGGQAGQGGARHPLVDVPGLSEDQRKAVRGAVGELKDRAHKVSVDDGNELRLRPGSDSSKDKLAGEVENAIRNQHLKNGSPSNGKLYYDALASTVGSFQTPVLKQKAAYRLLTGFNAGNPQRAGHGVFETSADSDFGDQQKEPVLGALRDEVDRVMAAYPPRDAQQRGNLARAVALVGTQKGASADELKPLLDKVRTGGDSPAGPGGSDRASTAAPGAAPHEPRITPDTSTAMPHAWDQKELREASYDHGARVSLAMQMRGEHDVADTATAIEMMAASAHHAYGLPMHSALKAAGDAVLDLSRTSPGGVKMTRDALRNADAPYFTGYLDQHAKRERDRLDGVQKAWNTDLPELIKSVIDDAIDAVSSEARAADGEWSGGGGGGHGASRLAREAVEEGASKLANKTGGGASAGAPTSNYSPAKVASDAGAFLGGEGAAYAATQGVEGILSRFFPEEAGGVKLIGAIRQAFTSSGAGAAAGAAARGIARVGAKNAASAAGGLAGFHAGAAVAGGAAQGAYRLAGAKAPDLSAKPQQSTGEQLSETLGSIGGAIVGSGLGAGVASIATGAAGGYVGAAIGRNAYDAGAAIGKWFGGYDSATTQRAISRATGPSPRSQAAPTAAPAQPTQPAQPALAPPAPPRHPRGEPGILPQ